MKLINVLLVLMTLCVSVVAQAQLEGVERGKSYREVLKMGLYPPDLIMRHQQRLAISDEQRTTISEVVKKFQSDVAQLQWTLHNEQQLLQQSLSMHPVDPGQALVKAERVLELESSFKLAHIELLIAVKNALTDEQIVMLKQSIREWREKNRK